MLRNGVYIVSANGWGKYLSQWFSTLVAYKNPIEVAPSQNAENWTPSPIPLPIPRGAELINLGWDQCTLMLSESFPILSW